MKSIFTDKQTEPSAADLENALGNTYSLWKELAAYTKEMYPNAIEKWHFSGDKYGWGFRISDPKRVLVYLLPRDRFFKVAFVFGQKATDLILESSISEAIKTELRTAKAYAEGRGIRIDVNNNTQINDLKALIHIKITC